MTDDERELFEFLERDPLADERELFQLLTRQMRDAFCEVREAATWDEREALTGMFFDAYEQLKIVWGRALLKRDVL